MSGCLIKNQNFIKDCFEKGYYFADAFGNIWSAKKPGPEVGTRNTSKKIFGGINNGYQRVVLCNSGKYLSALVHVVVYLYYNRSGFESSYHINHIDGNKLNNKIDNLELLSFEQNAAHAASKKLYRNGDRHPKWSNCRIDSHAICCDRLRGRTVRSIAVQYKTSASTISRICRLGGIKDVKQFRSKERFI